MAVAYYRDSVGQVQPAQGVFVVGGSTGGGGIGGTAIGFEQITTLAAAKGLTVPAGAGTAWIQAQVQAVRWRGDGVAPTATTGMLLGAGETLQYFGDLTKVRLIAAAAGAIAAISYYDTGTVATTVAPEEVIPGGTLSLSGSPLTYSGSYLTLN